MRSDLEILLDAEAPAAAGPDGDHFERFVRPFALAELERRAADRVELRSRVRALTVELRKLSQDDLYWISVGSDPEGLWRLAAAVWHGREPLARASAQQGRTVGEEPRGASPSELADPRST